MFKKILLIMFLCIVFTFVLGCQTNMIPKDQENTTSSNKAQEEKDYSEKEGDASLLKQKMVNFTLWSWQIHDGFIADNYAKLIKEANFDGIDFCIKWDKIEVEKGVFDFTYVDSVIEAIISNDLQVSLSLLFWSSGLTFKDEIEWQHDMNGNPYIYSSDRGSFLALNNEKNIEILKNTIEVFANHVNKKFGKHISRWHIRMSCYGELEYSPDIDLDYSPSALAAFYIYLEKKYEDVSSFNKDYKLDISSWEDLKNIELKTLTTVGSYDWKIFKQNTIVHLTDITTKIFKDVNPKIPVAIQVGSLWDYLAAKNRGVFDPYTVSKHVDILHIDDAPAWPHDFSIDMAQSIAVGKMTAMEIDGAQHSSAIPDAYLRQARMSGEAGMDYLNTANWNYHDIEYYGPELFIQYPDLFLRSKVRTEGDYTKAILFNTVNLICSPPAPLSNLLLNTYNLLSEQGTKKVRFVTDTMVIENKDLLGGDIKQLYLGQLGHKTVLTQELAEILAQTDCALIGNGGQKTQFVNPYGDPLSKELIDKLKSKIKP